ncbi:Protein of unknown function DUF490 [Cinnamomum micranthum f. kanehirae]|uniref:Uncharacterized protein n=1 Tax=Cinnamomum micranthum f. kanehirae TaxID=337451 RepID=A0A3S3PTH7_9MAGN|nr:Protein of unknown function DUF490 [Cinnamomum micranthum f. kanehirae]
MYRVNCMKESFSKSRTLIRSFSPLWMEGLLLFRCSVFAAVISVVGMLVWYGQIKAREFVEARILPSVCSTLSEYLQREIDLGKVQRVSPLGISLQSCSIGPNGQEFSCGAVPKMKLRVRPFASLRRGKIVIDAVLSRPSVLVVQKEDFSWLGIPSYSEAGLQSHCSNEEGIDFRTKTRRAAREEAAARCAADRKKAARQAAEMGYIVPEPDPISSDNDGFKGGASDSTEFPSSSSFYCMDEKVHRRDHHYMDMGIEYGLKHADLEKTFGVNHNSPWHAFWSRMITNPIIHSLKRKVSRKEISEVGFVLKRRNLERSAAAALAYFRGQDGGKFSRPFTEQGTPPSAGGHDGAQGELAGEKDEKDGKVNASALSSHDENSMSQSVFEPVFLEVGKNVEQEPVGTVYGQLRNNLNDKNGNLEYSGNLRSHHQAEDKHALCETDGFRFVHEPFLMGSRKLYQMGTSGENSSLSSGVARAAQISACDPVSGSLKRVGGVDPGASCNSLPDPMLEFLEDRSGGNRGDKCRVVSFIKLVPIEMHYLIPTWHISLKFQLPHISRAIELLSNYLVSHIQKLKSHMSLKVEDVAAKLADGVDEVQAEGIEKLLPVTLDSVYFTGGTLMLLGYGDREPREMENVNGHVKFKNHYGLVHVQLCGCCKVWRSDLTSKDGGWLSADVFVDANEQKWHANLKIANFFAPLFERILDIPITWSKGRASGEVHICMSRGETFPSLHGQLDVNGLAFQIFDAPSCFSEIAASLCFRGQRAFLHDASGWFGDAPLEASGDFGLNPEEGEFHLMCQVQCVEANALMKTFKMKPLLFPVAGLVTAVFNCRGPLEAPVFVGSGLISKKTAHYSATEFPQSLASEAVIKNKEAGAVAAFDRIPFSHVSVNFTFNIDNSVADLYGIRATLLDGGEIRGAGNAWICLEGEVDDSAMDVNLSGKLSSFEKVISRYLPGGNQLMPIKIGEINGETKLSGSLSRPRFDIKWAASKAEESFNDARGDIIISHDSFIASSSSVAFDLYMKVQTSYSDEYYWLSRKDSGLRNGASLTIEGVELDFRMRGFEFLNLISSYSFDSPRPMHLKATGRIKFQGKILKETRITDQNVLGTDKNPLDIETLDSEPIRSFVGEVLLSGIKLNQLMLAPQLVGSLNISPKNIKLDASGRPDENLTIEVVGPLWPTVGDNLQKRTISAALQKGQLRASISYRPQYSANLEEDLYELTATKALMIKTTTIVKQNETDEIGENGLIYFISNLQNC